MKKKHTRNYRYYHDINFHHRLRKWRRRKRFAIFIITVVLIAGAAIIIDGLLHRSKPSQPTAVTRQQYKIEDLVTFTTPYYQFQASAKWKEIVKEEVPGKYYYRWTDGNYVGHDLAVYVNSKGAAAYAATRVVPITIVSGKLKPDTVSNDCEEGFPHTTSRFPVQITYDGVTFTCDPEPHNFVAVAGMKGGNTDVTLTRPTGSKVTLGFVYRNLTATPDDREFNTVLRSIQTR